MTTEPDEPIEPTDPDATADDDLHLRFAAFRTLDTPAPPPVDELPAVRTPRVTRWPAVAAAVLVVTLLAVGTLVATSDRSDELSTTGPPATDVGTTTTTRPTTTSTSTSTTAPAETTTTTETTIGLAPTTVTIPGKAPTTAPLPTDPEPTTPRTPVDPFAPRNLVPPASVPQGPAQPAGQWLLEWEKAFGSPAARRSDTTFTINARFHLCSYGKNPFDTIKPPSVIETADAVVVTFWADSPAPPVFEPGPQDCPSTEFDGASPTYLVQLRAPLGDRWVYDGRPWASPSGPYLKLDPNFRGD